MLTWDTFTNQKSYPCTLSPQTTERFLGCADSAVLLTDLITVYITCIYGCFIAKECCAGVQTITAQITQCHLSIKQHLKQDTKSNGSHQTLSFKEGGVWE